MADGVSRGVEGIGAAIAETFLEDVLRLGVTGLARAGKTVFITALVANLMDRGRMPQLAGVGNIRAAWLQPQPDMTLPRFDYEGHLAALAAEPPRWPDSTRTVSELRLSLRIQPAGFFGALAGPRTLHLDIVDYPGEWLLDLGLLDRSYARWSAEVLARAAGRAHAAAYLGQAAAVDAAAAHDEGKARALAAAWTAALAAARAGGLLDCTPGRFLLPGELAGSPVLTFAPLPAPPAPPPRASLWRELERRYDAYVRKVVRPFFRDHFARIDRQIVLVDVLGAIHAGPPAVEDLRRAMADLLAAFRPGRNPWLSGLLRGRRIERILFAATKADHLHHRQHPQLAAIMEALVREARERADFAGARTAAMAIAALRATTEETVTHAGRPLDMVRGTLLETGRPAALYPGALPDGPAALLAPARAGATRWLDADYRLMAFAPARLALRPGEGPAHIRLDRAAEFLIGDRLG
ncbi:MAG: YcjX family protein [Rhodobacteraceae bacterium]|nr:YcjX family protein [Paracoccaceae bacterium]